MSETNGNKTIDHRQRVMDLIDENQTWIENATVEIVRLTKERSTRIFAVGELERVLLEESHSQLDEIGQEAARKARSQFVDEIVPQPEVKGFAAEMERKAETVKVGGVEVVRGAIYTSTGLATLLGGKTTNQLKRLEQARRSKRLKFTKGRGTSMNYRGEDVIAWLKAEEKGGKG